MISALISMKQNMVDLNYIEMFEKLKVLKTCDNENDENDDFKSRYGLPWTEAEDKFIEKCSKKMVPSALEGVFKKIPITDWNEKKRT